MSPSRKKVYVASVLVVAGLSLLVYGNIRQTMVYFHTPKEIVEMGKGAQYLSLRVGGLVKKKSLKKNAAALDSRFILTDGAYEVAVTYHGVLPDLFGEGKGAMVEGKIGETGIFKATAVMVKHGEEYKPHPLEKKKAGGKR